MFQEKARSIIPNSLSKLSKASILHTDKSRIQSLQHAQNGRSITQARASFRAQSITTQSGNGLRGDYFSGQSFNTLKQSRTDAQVNFNWKTGAPLTTLGVDNFSVRWTGQIMPRYSETYTFHTLSDDGIRLWVNGQQIINNWTVHHTTDDQGTIALQAGQKYDIKLEYYEQNGGATSKLLWASASQKKEIIPKDRMFSPPITPSVPASVTVNVNWSAVEGQTTSDDFGLNAYQGFYPGNVNNANYSANMKYMNPGMIRFHNAQSMSDSSSRDAGLLNTALKAWDAPKIASALRSSIDTFGAKQPQRMLNLPSFPSWMDTNNDRFLDANQFDNYANLCADLVKTVNKDNHLGVKYWEVLNEKDVGYYINFHGNGGWGGLINSTQPDRLNELITIYNKAATAMKRVDPTIEVGGPAIARSDLSPFYIPFIKGTVNNLDFFTYHVYATGSSSTSDADVYGKTNSIGNFTRKIVQALKDNSPNRHIPAFLDEYNISWTWKTHDPRMTNNKGAVFDALAMIQAIKNGADGTMAWNEKDDNYGKMNNQFVLRPSAHLFHLFNEYMVGDRAVTSSSLSGVTTFAVDGAGDPYKTYVLVNSSNTSQTVQTHFNGWVPDQQTVNEYSISGAGYTEQAINWNAVIDGSLNLPANSVIVLRFTG